MLIPILSLGNFAVGMGVFVAIGLLNPLSEAFNLDASQAGLILTIYAVSYAIASPFMGAVTGRWPRRTVLIVGLAIFSAAALLMASATHIYVMFFARILAAIGAGLFTPVTASVAASISSPENQGKALASVFGGLTFAQVLGVPAGSWIGLTFGWQSAFVIVAVLSFACMIAIAFVVPKNLPFQTANLASLREALSDWRSVSAIAFTASFLGSIYVIYTYLAPLLTELMGFGRNGLSISLMLFGLGAVLGNVLGGWMADKKGPSWTLRLLCLAQIILMPLFSFLPMPNFLLVILILLWSIAGWSFMAGQQIRVIQVSKGSPAVGLALNAAAIYVGASLGSAVGGTVIAGAGLTMLGLVGGVGAIFALIHLVLSDRMVEVAHGRAG